MDGGSSLAAVVVGGAIALAGTVVVQLWIVPRVERKNRAGERWEANLLALAELLSYELGEVVRDLDFIVGRWKLFTDLLDGDVVNEQGRVRVEEIRNDETKRLSEAARRYEQLTDFRKAARVAQSLRSRSRSSSAILVP